MTRRNNYFSSRQASGIFLSLMGLCCCAFRVGNAFLPIPTGTSTHRPRTFIESESRQYAVAPSAEEGIEKTSKRRRMLNTIGFKRLSRDQAEIIKAENSAQHDPKQKYNITSVAALQAYFNDEDEKFRDDKGEIDYDSLLNALNVQGDTQMIGSKEHLDYVHPVTKLLHERRRNNSMPTTAQRRSDGFRVALAIEGGGMRGCVSAGMAAALHHLNLTDTFDVIYGSSAGSIVGSYLLTRQVPWFGPEVYYDRLTTAGKSFIDTKRLLRALGFGLLDPRLLKDVLTRPEQGKPVLNLSFLLKTTMQETKPLNWERFVEQNKVQPLKVIASGLKSEEAVIMSIENGSFESLEELTSCMHASCLLPGIAGPLMNLNKTARAEHTLGKKVICGNNLLGDDMEPLADSLLFEPLPFRSAVKEGATHVVTIRSRPDGVDVTGKASVFERLIFRRFLLRKNRLPNIFKYLKQHYHKKRYGEDVLILNGYANSSRDYRDTAEPHILTIALPPGSAEVTKLETERQEIFEGLRRGFARAYDALVEDPFERGKGAQVAKECFPDEILDYDPLSITETKESAFEFYMKENQVVPQVWHEQQ